ncbi:MAG: SRPBCC family protein [Halanaeroarchaeum sp.]
MTVRVERGFDVEAPPEDVWEYVSDPTTRARAISVVDRFEQRDDSFVWHLALPIPFVRTTVEVRTNDVAREPPSYVKFRGRSSAFTVVGEHEISTVDGQTHVSNSFVVDGRVPGVERFFERNFGSEIANLERGLRRHLENR